MRVLLLSYLLTAASSAAETPESLAAMRHWTDLKFRGVSAAPPSASAFLRIRSSRILRNSIQDYPLQIGAEKFADGLAVRSVGEIDVVLPRGARRFEASLGADSNPVGYYSNSGRGNAIAAVRVDGREVFRSPVLKAGAAPISVAVELGGARSFALSLASAGDPGTFYQREWDQADWARARITLDDGSVLKLSELPGGALAESYPLDGALPFSFEMDQRPSTELLPKWKVLRSERRLDAARSEFTVTFSDPATRMQVRCLGVAYDDYPIVEWTLYFKNEGSAPGPMLEKIRSLDTRFLGLPNDDFVLHHARGSFNSERDFEPLETVLGRKADVRLASSNGRGSDETMPYFSLDWRGRGAIVAVGWPGQWDAFFRRNGEGVQVSAGLESTHLRLLPGEEIRTPLSVVLFWTGDWIDGQNIWRRWMYAHNLPRPGGKLPVPMLSASSSRQTVEMQGANEANQIGLLRRTHRALPIDYWWMDAGWYPMGNSWTNVGTWKPDPERFPRGLAPVTAAAHQDGLKTIVWFEPERVTTASEIFRDHPEWLLANGKPASSRILFLGNPDARHWLTEHVSNLLRGQGIDLYRQDFNIEPLAYWRMHDAPDRQGITEKQHITGYLAYFDELRRRFPGLLIDTCASGGRRIDLETLRRAVPLWRSDHPFEPVSQQNQTYGISLWAPYHGTAINAADPYVLRSQISPATGIGMVLSEVEDTRDALRRLLGQWRDLSRHYRGDFYPLTSWTADPGAWMAWQFATPESGDGFVQVFRRAQSPFTQARLKLRGLDADAEYVMESVDAPGQVQRRKGSELMGAGFEVVLAKAPEAAIYRYRRAK